MKGASGRIWKWIKDIQATKHEYSWVAGNENIQSEFEKKKNHQGNGNEYKCITYILEKGNKKML